jgi:uncharacterized FlaG/YvyC family protein
MNTVLPSGIVQGSTSSNQLGGAGARQVVSEGGNNLPVNKATPESPSSFSSTELAAAVAEFSSQVEMVATSLSISVDKQLGSTIIKVTDRETDEVIRQIPPERIVNLARFMRESTSEGGFELAETMKGLLLDGNG